ncbi:MAG: Hsp20/alpha crystallin family protein [Armatimonadota bacterium]
MAKLARWQPITEVERWFDRFDRLFDRMLNRFFRDWERDFWNLTWRHEQWVPAMEVSETPDAYIVRAELPGVKTDDIEVTIQDDILTIRGKRERSEEHKDEKVHFVERSYGEFVRSLRIPTDVKVDAVEASYKDGILEVRLPKSEESKPRRIEVKVA